MDLADALAYARTRRNGVLTTLKRDGRPQLSNVVYAVGDDDVVRVSVTATRAKTANIRRDPRVALHVTSDDFWAYVVFEGDAELSPVSTAPGDATGQELAGIYRVVRGEHPDWDEYFAKMVDDQRLVVRLAPTGVVGMLPRT